MKKFTAKQLMNKTMPFVWAKLIIRAAEYGVFLALLALFIWGLTRDNPSSVLIWGTFIVFIFGSVLTMYITRIVAYGVRVGHIAVLTEIVKTGEVPANQVAYGKNKVMERIGAAATFFFINKLVDRSVQQLQNRLANAASFLGRMPGMNKLVGFAKMILKIALKYVDECCVAWIFYGPQEQSAMKGALDGVTLYAQNWKVVLGVAVKTAIKVMVLTFLLGVAITVLFVFILSNFGAGGFWVVYGIFAGFMIALAFKQAFIDSWVMTTMLVTFLNVAPTTELKIDMYGKLSLMSASFKKMVTNVQGEISGDPFAPAPVAHARTASPGGSTVFCGECGARNPAGTRFCSECGKGV